MEEYPHSYVYPYFRADRDERQVAQSNTVKAMEEKMIDKNKQMLELQSDYLTENIALRDKISGLTQELLEERESSERKSLIIQKLAKKLDKLRRKSEMTISDLRSQCKALEIELVHCKEQLLEKELEIENLNLDVNSLRRELDKVKKEFHNSEENWKIRFERSETFYKNRMKELGISSERNDTTKFLHSKMEEYQELYMASQTQMDKLETEHFQLKQQYEFKIMSYNQLERELNRLKSQPKPEIKPSFNTQKIEEQTSTFLRRENQTLKEELQHIKKENQDLDAMNKDYIREMQAITLQNMMLIEKTKEAEEKSQMVMRRYEALEKTIEKQSSTIGSIKSQVPALFDDLSHLQQTIEDKVKPFQKVLDSNKIYRENIQSLNSERKKIQRKLVEQNSIREEMMVLHSKLENYKMCLRVSDGPNRDKEISSMASEDLTINQRRIESLREIIDELETTVLKYSEDCDNKENMITELTETLEVKELDLEKSSKTISNFQVELTEKNNEIRNLHQEITQKDTLSNQKLEELKAFLSQKDQDIHDQVFKSQELTQEIENLRMNNQQILSNQRDEILQLENTYRKNLEEKDMIIHNTEMKCEEELKNCKDKINELNQELTFAMSSNIDFAEEIKQLRQSLSSISQDFSTPLFGNSLVESVLIPSDTLEDKSQYIDELENKNKALVDELRDKDFIIQQVNKEIAEKESTQEASKLQDTQAIIEQTAEIHKREEKLKAKVDKMLKKEREMEKRERKLAEREFEAEELKRDVFGIEAEIEEQWQEIPRNESNLNANEFLQNLFEKELELEKLRKELIEKENDIFEKERFIAEKLEEEKQEFLRHVEEFNEEKEKFYLEEQRHAQIQPSTPNLENYIVIDQAQISPIRPTETHDSSSFQDQLKATEENNISLVIENKKLEAKTESLKKQMETLRRLIQRRDEQTPEALKNLILILHQILS